ncbi:MAG TPA: hypothetical protein VFL34_18300 [Candidatus Sulfotelmatobacter sp.]|nr:hypothetical protein [Candidatus Sulfotelmatobacter sp.]
MELAEQKDGEHVRTSRAQKNSSSDFPLFQLSLFLHQRHGVVMDGVRDLVTQSSGKLLGVLHEVKERIDNIHVAAGSCESVRLRFVNQVKLERVVVARLRSLRNGIGDVPKDISTTLTIAFAISGLSCIPSATMQNSATREDFHSAAAFPSTAHNLQRNAQASPTPAPTTAKRLTTKGRSTQKTRPAMELHLHCHQCQ